MSIYQDCLNGNSAACARVVQVQNFVSIIKSLKRIIKIPKIGPDPVPDVLLDTFKNLALEVITSKVKGDPSPQPNITYKILDPALVNSGISKAVLNASLLQTSAALKSLQQLIDNDIASLNSLGKRGSKK